MVGGAEKNVHFLLKDWLPEKKKEEGTVSLIKMTAQSSSLGEELRRAAEGGLRSCAGSFCVWEEAL